MYAFTTAKKVETFTPRIFFNEAIIFSYKYDAQVSTASTRTYNFVKIASKAAGGGRGPYRLTKDSEFNFRLTRVDAMVKFCRAEFSAPPC